MTGLVRQRRRRGGAYKVDKKQRKGGVIVLAAIMMVVMVGMLAFANDLGIICIARTHAQRAADACALASGWELTDDDRIRGQYEAVYQNLRTTAAEYAQQNEVFNGGTTIVLNQTNADDGDVVIGRLSNPNNPNEALNTSDPSSYNAVTVRIRRTTERANAIPYFFARIFGMQQGDVSAEATAIYNDNISGFRVTGSTGNSSLMPFVIHKDAWQDLIVNGNGDDNWGYDKQTGVYNSSDQIPEIVMFPGSSGSGNGNGKGGNGNGGNQITPGNFGTVDIGSSGNSTSHLRDLILNGPNQQDLAYHGGSLELDPVTETLQLGGDTGMSVGMESALEEVIGQPRTVMLYDTVTGNGNNTVFTIVGFVGIRIVDFNFNGSNKYIRVQPAYVIDPTAVTGQAGNNHFVGQPVHLVR